MSSSTSNLNSVIPTESEVSNMTLSDFQLGRRLGKGSYGQVFAARHKSRRAPIALKIIKMRPDQTSQNHHDEIHREVRVLRALDSNSPFTLSFYGAFSSQSETALILELAGGGNLKNKLRSYGNAMRERDARFYVAELACALESLRSRRIVHRDLKIDNILLTRDGHVKIGDYGSATILVNGYENQYAGTPNIVAPQLLRKEEYTEAADWYSLGLVLYELVVGRSPFPKYSCHHHSRVEHCSLSSIARVYIWNEIQYPPFLSPECKHLISRLTWDSESGRIKCLQDISRHPWFRGTDWNMVMSGRSGF